MGTEFEVFASHVGHMVIIFLPTFDSELLLYVLCVDLPGFFDLYSSLLSSDLFSSESERNIPVAIRTFNSRNFSRTLYNK